MQMRLLFHGMQLELDLIVLSGSPMNCAATKKENLAPLSS
jgi:hypothetical protein